MPRKRAKHKQDQLDERAMTYHDTSNCCGNCKHFWSWQNGIKGQCNPKQLASGKNDCTQIMNVVAFGFCNIWEPKNAD